jgi:hypothetical protein
MKRKEDAPVSALLENNSPAQLYVSLPSPAMRVEGS